MGSLLSCADKAAWLPKCLARSQSSQESPVAVPVAREVPVWALTAQLAGRHCMWLQLSAAATQPLKPCKVQVMHQSQNKNYFGFVFSFCSADTFGFFRRAQGGFVPHMRHLLWQHLSPLQVSALCGAVPMGWAIGAALPPSHLPWAVWAAPHPAQGLHHGSRDVVPCLWRSLTYFGAGSWVCILPPHFYQPWFM